MECFLPTEIARLVYGYLDEEGCAEAAKTFLETSTYMQECTMAVTKGRRFNTKVMGLSLIDILDILAEVTCFVKTMDCATQTTRDEILIQLKSTLNITNDRKTTKPVYLRFTMPTSPKKPRKTKPTSNSSPLQKSADRLGCSENDVHSSTPANAHALQLLLENKALHEKLAENINRVVANKNESESLEKVLEKKIIETIVNTTEQDPIFQQMLDELVGPNDVVPDCLDSHEDGCITPLSNSGTLLEEVNDVQMTWSDMKEQQPDWADERSIVEKAMASSGVTGYDITHLPLDSSPPSCSTLTFQTCSIKDTVQHATSSPILHSSLTGSHILSTTSTSSCLSAPPLCSSSDAHTKPILDEDNWTSKPTSPYKHILPKPKEVNSSIRFMAPRTRRGRPPKSSICILPSPSHSILEELIQTKNIPLPNHIREKVAVVKPVRPTVKYKGARTRGGKTTNIKMCTRLKSKSLLNTTSEESLSQSIISESNISNVSEISDIRESPEKNENCPSIASNLSIDAPPMQPTDKISIPIDSLLPNSVVASVPATHQVEDEVESPIHRTNESDAPKLKATSTTNLQIIKPDTTPLQETEPRIKLTKRLSLSTPRKGPHVRTLEFKTPPKCGTLPRKSLSSPKNKMLNRLPHLAKNLESVKRAKLFKSPIKKKDRPAWDAHLRIFTGEENPGPCNSTQKSPPVDDKTNELTKLTEKSTDLIETSKSPFSCFDKTETNEDLVSRIRKDVMDVINEEDLEDLNANSLGKNVNPELNDVCSRSIDPLKSPISTGSVLEIGDIGVASSTIKKLYSLMSGDENSSTLGSPISKIPKEMVSTPKQSHAHSRTPSKTPDNVRSVTPISLESTLINECTRIEKNSIMKELPFLESPNRLSAPEKTTQHRTTAPEEIVSRKTNLPPPKGIVLLKTPAKTDPPAPVEMTPISKIIHEETRLSRCTLLTPTIPPTPNVDELKLGGEKSDSASPSSPQTKAELKPNQITVSPPINKKSSKSPSVTTPPIRLRTKTVKQDTLKSSEIPSSKRNSSFKKTNKDNNINCSKLIAQCLQDVKDSLYGPEKSDSNEELITDSRKKATTKPAQCQRKTPKKRKPPVKKKNKTSSTEVKNAPPALSLADLELMERYKNTIEIASSSENEDVEAASKTKANLSSEVLAQAKQSMINQFEDQTLNRTANKSAVSKKEVTSLTLIKNRSDQNSANKSECEVQDLPRRSGVSEEESFYPHQFSPRLPHLNSGNHYLDTFVFPFTLEGSDGNMINHNLRMSPHFNIFEIQGTCGFPISSHKSLSRSVQLSNDTNSSEVHGNKRRRRTSSRSSDTESTNRKRKRSSDRHNELRRNSPPSYRGGGRTRGRGRGRGIPNYYDADFRSSRRDSSRRLSKQDKDRDARRHEFRSRISVSPDRRRSKSSHRSECDERRSSEKSRSVERKHSNHDAPRKERGKSFNEDARRKDRHQHDLSRRPTSVGDKLTISSDNTMKKQKDSSEHPGFRRIDKNELKHTNLKSAKKTEAARHRQMTEFEEGEISDTSHSTVISFSKKLSKPNSCKTTARVTSPVPEDTRQALLQQVDLDSFLSYVHGNEGK